MCTDYVGGDVDFDALFEREYVPLVRVAFVIVADEGLAREIVQEAFARALGRWRRVSHYERPGAWLRLVTVRLALRTRDRRKREGALALDALPAAADRDSEIDLLAAVASLPPLDRAAIVLHHLCDLPVEEVAQIIRSTAGATAVRLHRARAKLAAVLGEEADHVDR